MELSCNTSGLFRDRLPAILRLGPLRAQALRPGGGEYPFGLGLCNVGMGRLAGFQAGAEAGGKGKGLVAKLDANRNALTSGNNY